MRTFKAIHLLPVVAALLCAGVAACSRSDNKLTASGDEYSGAFPSVDPLADSSDAAQGEMAIPPGSASASS
jgi:hypothetical protein